MDVSQLKLYVDRYTRGHDYFDSIVHDVDKKKYVKFMIINRGSVKLRL